MLLTDIQKPGLLLLTACSVIAYIIQLLPSDMPARVNIPHSQPSLAFFPVELKGSNLAAPGIYYLSEGTTVGDLLKLAQVKKAQPPELLVARLNPGASYTVDENGIITINVISNTKRLALGLTIDINESTKEELMFIPGIGEKTAERILAFRKLKGRIRNLDDLKEIPGIKEKRLAEMKKHLHAKK